tara:strand:- start:4 stop:216 length:213 start_codon:yes stop_codon:yes gene_type:complete
MIETETIFKGIGMKDIKADLQQTLDEVFSHFNGAYEETPDSAVFFTELRSAYNKLKELDAKVELLDKETV